MRKTYLSVPYMEIPQTSITIEGLARTERFSNDIEYLRHSECFENISIAADATLTELAIAAGRNAISRSGMAAREFALVLYTHHWEDESWNHIHPFRMHEALGLREDAEVVELRNGNGSSILRSIDMGRRLLEADEGMENILVIASDKVNRLVMRRRFASSVFGDAAAAAILSSRPQAFAIVSDLYVSVFSRFNDIPSFKGVQEAEWVEETVGKVASGLDALLRSVGKTTADLAGLVTTNMSPKVAGRVAEATNIPPSLFFSESRKSVAQAVASELLLNFAYFAPGRKAGDLVALVAQGLGGSCHILLLSAETDS